jgi:SPP1 gp7 family putative phage head morphogenesis protein
MADIYTESAKFRSRLLKNEKAAAMAIVQSYALALKRVTAEIDALTAKMQAGGTHPGWLYEEQRLQKLQAAIAQNYLAWKHKAGLASGQAVSAAALQGAEDAAALVELYKGTGALPLELGVGSQLSTATIEQIAAATSSSSPIRKLFDPFGPAAVESATNAFISGVATGKNPRVIAAELKESLAGDLNRALLIARSETLRAYRESSRQAYEASEVVKGWRWLSARSPRTCAVCWALDGTEHAGAEPMATHPNCRCTTLPVFPGTVNKPKTGVELFAELDEGKQAAILGPKKFELYKAGELTLPQLVQPTIHPLWGAGVREASIATALGKPKVPLPSPPPPKVKKPKTPKPSPVTPEPPAVTQPPPAPPPAPAAFNVGPYQAKAPFDDENTPVKSTGLRSAAKTARNSSTFSQFEQGHGKVWDLQVADANRKLRDAGLDELDYEVKLVKLSALSRSSQPDQARAEHIAEKLKGFADKKIDLGDVPEDFFTPVVVDADGKIVDGNARHRAAEINGDTHVLAFVPKAKGTGKIANKEKGYEAIKAVPAGRDLLVMAPPPPPPPPPKPIEPKLRDRADAPAALVSAHVFPSDPNSLKVVKKLGGSTGAELVEAPDGTRYVRKRGANPDHLREEFIADSAYRALGVQVPEAKVYETPGGPVKLARFVKGRVLSELKGAEKDRAEAALRESFVADALLGNWDVIGLGRDNVLQGDDGITYRIDNGGSLRFRAMGARKDAGAFDENPFDLWSLRSPTKGATTAPVFGKLSIFDVADQVEKFRARKTDLINSLPPELRDLVAKRFAQLEEIAEIAKTYEADHYRADYVDEVTRHVVGLRAAGVEARLPQRLTNKSDKVTVADENGKTFDHFRGSDSVIADVHKYMKAEGGSPEQLADWMGAQAGSSWSDQARALKYQQFKIRTVGEAATYWHTGGINKSKKAFDESEKKYGAGSFNKSQSVLAAFNLLFLRRVEFQHNLRGDRFVELMRTESSDVVKSSALKSGQKGRTFARGNGESHSIFRKVTVHGTFTTRMRMPHHRILGMYFFARRTSGYEANHGSFLGDNENEFVCNPEGIPVDCD